MVPWNFKHKYRWKIHLYFKLPGTQIQIQIEHSIAEGWDLNLLFEIWHLNLEIEHLIVEGCYLKFVI